MALWEDLNSINCQVAQLVLRLGGGKKCKKNDCWLFWRWGGGEGSSGKRCRGARETRPWIRASLQFMESLLKTPARVCVICSAVQWSLGWITRPVQSVQLDKKGSRSHQTTPLPPTQTPQAGNFAHLLSQLNSHWQKSQEIKSTCWKDLRNLVW